MNKPLNDFPIYGICSDEDKLRPMSVSITRGDVYCSLLIEQSIESALMTVRKINAIMPPSGRVRIEKLFNLQQVENFRRYFDWSAKNASRGFSGILFNDDKAAPDISKLNFIGWGEVLPDC